MASFSMWVVLGVTFFVGHLTGIPSGIAIDRFRRAWGRAMKAAHEVKWLVRAVGFSVVGLVLVGLVGIRYYHPFGLFG